MVGHSKNVIVFDPQLTVHVIRRMRRGHERIFNGNQRETLLPTNQERIVISRQKRYISPVDSPINFKLCGNYRRGGRRVWYTF